DADGAGPRPAATRGCGRRGPAAGGDAGRRERRGERGSATVPHTFGSGASAALQGGVLPERFTCRSAKRAIVGSNRGRPPHQAPHAGVVAGRDGRRNERLGRDCLKSVGPRPRAVAIGEDEERTVSGSPTGVRDPRAYEASATAGHHLPPMITRWQVVV